MAGLYVPVDPIPREAPRYNLVDSAEPITLQRNPITDRDDYDWARGVTLRDVWNAELSSWQPDCSVWPGGNKPDITNPSGPLTWEDFAPFEVYTELTCQTSGRTVDMEELQQIAKDQLRVGATKAIEAELWTGAQSALGTLDTPNLQTGATIVGGGTAVDYSFGLAVAGQALANCGIGARGFIHAPPIVAQMWAAQGHTEEDDRGRLITKTRGDVIVVGSGYPGTGVNGAAVSGNESWIFATSPVAVAMDPEPQAVSEKLEENIDRSTNTFTARAVTLAVYMFDPSCQFAIKVDW